MERYPESSARKLRRVALGSALIALVAAASLVVPTIASAQVEPYSEESPTVLPLQLAATPADEVTETDEGSDDEVLGKRIKKDKKDDGGGGGGGGSTEGDGDLPELEEVAADIGDEAGAVSWFIVFGFLGLVLMLLFLFMKRRWKEEEEGEELV